MVRLRPLRKMSIMFNCISPNIFENTEGVSVEILGRWGIRYSENEKTVNVQSEILVTPQIAIYVGSICKWDNGDAIDEAMRNRIIKNIRDAVRSQGEDLVLI